MTNKVGVYAKTITALLGLLAIVSVGVNWVAGGVGPGVVLVCAAMMLGAALLSCRANWREGFGRAGGFAAIVSAPLLMVISMVSFFMGLSGASTGVAVLCGVYCLFIAVLVGELEQIDRVAAAADDIEWWGIEGAWNADWDACKNYYYYPQLFFGRWVPLDDFGSNKLSLERAEERLEELRDSSDWPGWADGSDRKILIELE